ELVLHLRVFAILAQFEQLSRAIHRADVQVGALFAGPIRSIDELESRVYGQLSRVWLEYGHVLRAPGGCARRNVVREANKAVTMIGSDPDLMHVLRIAMTHPDWPTVFCPCANLAELLALSIEMEPDPALFQATPDPELIDDVPASVRAGLRHDERKR
ncbi:MAG: hypothetical protein ACREBE_09215, partial [bacterium]